MLTCRGVQWWFVVEFWKRFDAAHFRHDIDPHTEGLGMLTSEMNGIATFEILEFERRQGNNPAP